MAVDRMKRVNELLRREISDVLFRLLQNEDVDISAFTLTRVITSRNLRYAKVKISIREHVGERRKMMAMIKRHRKYIQSQINKDCSFKYTPRLSFELDESVSDGDKVLDLLQHLDPNDSKGLDYEPGDADCMDEQEDEQEDLNNG